MLFRFDDFDRTFALLDGLHRRRESAPRQPRARDGGWADLQEDEHALTLRADLPGVRDEDLELTLRADELTLTARRTLAAPEGHRAHLSERRGFEVTRSFALPVSVDPEKVRATLQDGVLTVRLAKAEAVRPRTIAITAG